MIMAEQLYRVTAGMAGPHVKGSIISESECGPWAEHWLATGGIEKITAKEAKEAEKEAESNPAAPENTTGDMRFSETEFRAQQDRIDELERLLAEEQAKKASGSGTPPPDDQGGQGDGTPPPPPPPPPPATVVTPPKSGRMGSRHNG